jgi:glycerol 3-phosphatase-2
MLRASAEPLCRAYDLVMLDLDGVVYVGPEAVPGAADRLAQARASGVHLAYVTNNASRPPDAVAEHLRQLGVPADVHDVVTSAQAAARLVADMVPPGARILMLGGQGLDVALRERGFEPVTRLEDQPVAVVTGYGPDLRWRQIMQGAVQIRAGLPWVASNADLTIPTDYGVGPGHGVLVRMLEEFSGVTPSIAGKPERPLLDETVARVGGKRPLMVGDRLDTDILGAHNAEVDSLLVLTGVTGLHQLAAATPEERPTYVSVDLGGLLTAHAEPTRSDGGWISGGWHASVMDGSLAVSGDGTADDWWRSVASAAWAYLDRTGDIVAVDDVTPPVPDSTTGGR